MKFLKNFTDWIKGWRLDKFFKGFVNGDEKAGAELQRTVELSNEFIARVLGWLKNPIGDVVEAVIPGEWDTELRAKGIEVLEKITTNSGKLMGCLQLATTGEQLTCIYGKIVELNDEDEVDSFKQKIAVFAARIFADGKIKGWGDGVIAAQFVFDLVTSKRKKAA